MGWARALAAVGAAVAVGLVAVSGESEGDPRTPPALAGMPPPFLGTAVVGGGGAIAAVDAYGDVVDLRSSPAGTALIENPAARQTAGSVPADTGIVPRVAIGNGPALPLWRADSVSQRYLPGTNVVRTVARFLFRLTGRKGTTQEVSVVVTDATVGGLLARMVATEAPPGVRVAPMLAVNVEPGVECETEQRPGRAALICRAPRSGAYGGEDSATVGGRIDPLGVRERIDSLAGPAEAASTAERVTMITRLAALGDRGWLARARALGAGAPAWAQKMQERSLLTLRALTDRRSGAVAAGARDGWAYVWPRDAGAVALAFAAAGYREEARRVARFLLGLDLETAARFHGDGTPVEGRAAQGDAAGWVAVAAQAAAAAPRGSAGRGSFPAQEAQKEPRDAPAAGAEAMARAGWRDRADYREGDPGDFLANAIASTAIPSTAPPAAATPLPRRAVPYLPPRDKRNRATDGSLEQAGPGALATEFGTPRGLVRSAGDPGSGLDSAAAWAVRPFAQPSLFPAARRTLLRLVAGGTRFGITPGEGWEGGADPWSAPTAWSAWALAALADAEAGTESARVDRRQALRLLTALRRAATPAGALPERVDLRTGVPRSTTPLAWSHAFAILALRQLWPK